MNYWKECISIAADECNLLLTDKQLECLSDSVQGGFENYNMAFGYNCIPNPIESRAQEELQQLKKEKESHENWELSTKPCRNCATTGIVEDIWGRNVTCGNCNGKGRN